MHHYQFHLITDDRIINLPEFIVHIIDCGITTVQLRNKNSDKLFLYEIGKKILKITQQKKIPFLINDHVDVALALDADGVHIGQTDLPYHAARKILGKKKIIGLSIQNMEQAKNAIHYDANYFGVGPLFPSRTKSDVSAIGLNNLNDITQILNKPCIAIGGIEIHHVKTILNQGAEGVAVINGVFNADNPRTAALNYAKELIGE